MYGEPSTAGVIVTIQYTTIEPMLVFDSAGTFILQNSYAEDTLQQELPSTACGQWRLQGRQKAIGNKSRLQFYITPGCTLSVKSIYAMQGTIKLADDPSEFITQGYVPTFQTNMGTLLGLDANFIEVYTVQEGSTIVEFFGLLSTFL